MVALPLAYHAQAEVRPPLHYRSAAWPTVYVLDGNWYFSMVAGMVRPSAWCGDIRDAIIVGIGYPEKGDAIEDFAISFTRRDHDLTPIHDPGTERWMTDAQGRPVPNGDGANFHRFLRDELIPFIEGAYRADPSQRILAGHSYGGLFALQGLFITPDLFATLIIGSPYLAYGDRVLFAQEEEFAKTHDDLAVRLYFFASVKEMSHDDTTLADTLLLAGMIEGRKYPGLTVIKKVFSDFNHCEVGPAGLHAGLMFALKP